jgi:hypothetical protein
MPLCKVDSKTVIQRARRPWGIRRMKRNPESLTRRWYRNWIRCGEQVLHKYAQLAAVL